MSDTLLAAALFLINTLFDIYLFILVIRLILVWVGASYFDPITQFVVKMTDFIVKPLRKILPNVQRLELSTLLLILVVESLKFLCVSLLSAGVPAVTGLLLLAIGDALKLILQTFFYGILLQVVMSWVQPHSPTNYFLIQFTSPIMRPLHRIIPPIAGFDITPIPAMLLLQLLMIVLVNPIMAMGFSAAFS
jgi:YggT family protein